MSIFYAATFTNSGTSGSFHFQAEIYSDCSQQCLFTTSNSELDPSLWSTSKGTSEPTTVDNNETITVYIDPTGLANWNELQGREEICITWSYKKNTGEYTEFVSKPVITLLEATEKEECPLFDFIPNYASQRPSVLVENRYPVIDLSMGVPVYDNKASFGRAFSFEFDFIFKTKAEIDSIISFFKNRYGSGESFCMASWMNEYTVGIQTAASASGVVINGTINETLDDRYIMIVPSGTQSRIYRKVTTTAPITTFTVINTTEQNGVTIPVGSKISPVRRVYFDEDTLELSFTTANVATARFTFREELRPDSQNSQTLTIE